MSDDRSRLEHELRQIIQTDRMAMDILQNAKDTRKSIDAKTQREKEAILQQAAQKKEADLKQLQETLNKELEEKKHKATLQYTAQIQALQQTMAQHQQEWADEIASHILQLEQ